MYPIQSWKRLHILKSNSSCDEVEMYVQVVWLQNLPWLNVCWTVGAPEHGPMIFSLCFYDLQVCVCRMCATMYIFALCLFPSRCSCLQGFHV